MGRQIDLDKPLSKEDIAYLRTRYADQTVDYMVSVSGAEPEKADPEAEAKAAEQAQADAAEAAQKAEDERLATEAAEAEAKAQAEAADLIGTPAQFDVVGATEAEVKTWVETASDEDKATALSAEQAREDREARKGVVAILS